MGDALLLLVYDKPDAATLKAVDLALTGVRWAREVPGGWTSARTYLWQDAAFAGSGQGNLGAFSADGSEKWSDTVGGVIRGIGVADGVLYVGTQKGTLYAHRPLPAPTQRN